MALDKMIVPVIFSATAVLAYAVIQVMLKDFSNKHNVFVIYVSYAGYQFAIMLTMMILTWDSSNPKYVFPHDREWIAVIVMGVLFAIGTSCNYLAFEKGGTIQTITCIMLLLPVFATAINFARTGELPNLWQVGSFAAAVVMILLAVKGIMVDAEAKAAAKVALLTQS